MSLIGASLIGVLLTEAIPQGVSLIGVYLIRLWNPHLSGTRNRKVCGGRNSRSVYGCFVSVGWYVT
jgi:hypothetical protein